MINEIAILTVDFSANSNAQTTLFQISIIPINNYKIYTK